MSLKIIIKRWLELNMGSPYSWNVACYPWNYCLQWSRRDSMALLACSVYWFFHHCASVCEHCRCSRSHLSHWPRVVCEWPVSSENRCLHQKQRHGGTFFHAALWKLWLSPWDETSLNSVFVHFPQKALLHTHNITHLNWATLLWNDNSENKFLPRKKDLFFSAFEMTSLKCH